MPRALILGLLLSLLLSVLAQEWSGSARSTVMNT
jgi:hypothetical protein